MGYRAVSGVFVRYAMPERKACQWQKVTITVITAIALGTTAMAIMAAVTEQQPNQRQLQQADIREPGFMRAVLTRISGYPTIEGGTAGGH